MSLKISHHLLLCATSTKATCCDPNEGAKCWSQLKKILQHFDLENPKRIQGIVLRSKVDCLRICKNGPILLVWPDGIWYGGVDSERIEEIVKSHIIGGKPLKDLIIKVTPQAV